MNIEESIMYLKIKINTSKKQIESGEIWLDSLVSEEKNSNEAIETLLTAYEKEKETSHYNQSQLDIANAKLVEEKEKNKLLEKNYSSAHEDINWFCENYISKEESKQKERKAYIKGTNDAHELCNKKWEDKIKAKIEELEKLDFGTDLVSQFTANLTTITILQSLLEKE